MPERLSDSPEYGYFHYFRASFRSFSAATHDDIVTVSSAGTPRHPASQPPRLLRLASRGGKIHMVQTSASFRRDAQDVDGSISLSEIISALSYALDLTEGAVHGHALRSCLLGMRIAAEANLPSEQTSSLYFALLLKDIGCSSNTSRMCQIMGDDDW